MSEPTSCFGPWSAPLNLYVRAHCTGREEGAVPSPGNEPGSPAPGLGLWTCGGTVDGDGRLRKPLATDGFGAPLSRIASRRAPSAMRTLEAATTRATLLAFRATGDKTGPVGTREALPPYSTVHGWTCCGVCGIGPWWIATARHAWGGSIAGGPLGNRGLVARWAKRTRPGNLFIYLLSLLKIEQ